MRYLVILFIVAGCSSQAVVSENQGEGEGCNSPLGFISEGRTATGYLHQFESSGQPCEQGTLSCDGGAWSGAYIYPSCVRTQ